jgi:hypothetical protein
MIQQYNFGRQFIIFLIASFLLLVYIKSPFENEDYNKLALAFSIFNYAWLLTLIVRYLYFYNKSIDLSKSDTKSSEESIENSSSSNIFIRFFKKIINVCIPVPYGLKCLFGESGCERGNISFLSFFHFIGYFIIGVLIPDYYWEIIILSYACEFIELGLGFTPKFIIDPLINISGYAIGSALSPYN